MLNHLFSQVVQDAMQAIMILKHFQHALDAKDVESKKKHCQVVKDVTQMIGNQKNYHQY